MMPQDNEDIWHVYNLILVGDKLTASSYRRIQTESYTGTVESSKIRLTLSIVVETIEADLPMGQLRINGRVCEENVHVKMGAYHTIDLELHREFTLYKEHWDTIAIERLHEISQVGSKAEVGAIVLQEGLANVCLLTDNMTVIVQRIETNIPKKRKGNASSLEKATRTFYNHIYQAILKHLDFEKLKVIIIGSPGFLKESFFAYMNEEAIRNEEKVLIHSKSKFMLVHCSNGHIGALKEVLEDPAILAKLSDTKYAREMKLMEQFYNVLSTFPEKAYYGFKDVEQACDHLAIDSLLVSDALFRSSDVAERKKYIQLVEKTRKNRGKVYIFSSSHVSGEQLGQLTGVAAILSYPLSLEE